MEVKSRSPVTISDIIAMRSENALSLLSVLSSSVYGSRSPRSRTHWKVPTVIDGRVASPSDSGGEPSQTMQLFKHKFDAELVKKSSCMCLPDPSMSLTDCVLLWSDGCCRHEFDPSCLSSCPNSCSNSLRS